MICSYSNIRKDYYLSETYQSFVVTLKVTYHTTHKTLNNQDSLYYLEQYTQANPENSSKAAFIWIHQEDILRLKDSNRRTLETN